MYFNLITNIETCSTYIVQNKDFLSFVYYSHIPTALIALFIGIIVLIKDKKSLLNRILMGITLAFFFWAFFDLVLWVSIDSRKIMFAWSLLGILNALIFVLSFYFVYVFIYKKDLPLSNKLFLLFFLIPVLVMTPTELNLHNFDITNCQATEGSYFTNYYLLLGLVISLWIIVLAFLGYRRIEKERRRQVLLLTLGVELFLLSFFSAVFLNSYLVDSGYITDIVSYKIEQYGLFGMTFFMGVLGYMIVKFKAFNIKVIGAQALIISLFILIASQFAFIQNPTNKILNGITLFLVSVFGFNLIKSVKREIAQKEALAQANEEINERKNQLQRISDHLATANAKLKELDNAKSEFVSIVAHQLQGPPTTVKGYSMLLTEGSYGELNPEQKDIIQKIFNANEQQVAFVDDLLSVSRLESGRVLFNFERNQMADICQEVIDNLFVKAKDKGLYLEFNKPEQIVPEIKVDKAKMREAISNLVDNAIKYTKRGGVNLSLTICSLGGEKCIRGNHLRIMVSDTGIGIPNDEMPRLFSKFSRGKDVKRLNANGTGLGLYVVKMISEGNRGKVWVESDGEGKGSRFIIELPLG